MCNFEAVGVQKIRAGIVSRPELSRHFGARLVLALQGLTYLEAGLVQTLQGLTCFDAGLVQTLRG